MTVLRLYTEYSLLTGECRLNEITAKAAELGYTSVAKTDKGTLAGNIEFFEHAKRNNINPILGCEIKSFVKGEEISLLILAKNNEGIYSLNIYSSFAMTEKSGYVPENILSKYSKDVFAIWIESEAVIEKSKENARKTLDALKSYFPNLYGGIQRLPEDEKEKSESLYKFFAEKNVSCVISNPVYMTSDKNGEILSLLNFIKSGEKGKKENYPYFLRSSDEIKKLFSHIPQVLDATEKIGNSCCVSIDTSSLHLPSFPTEDSPSLLREKAIIGLKFHKKDREEKYIQRLNSELETIEKMGFSDYFLITEDFVSYAIKENIQIGHGRGSGVGSLVAYCLGITAVDPVENNLFFERFLNEERVTMPDFDIDISDEEREKVISYVREKYGKKHVCKIANYSRFAFRQVIRDVGKYLNWDPSSVITLIPDRVGITVNEALKENEALKKEAERNKNAREALRLCMLLEGRPRVVSPHPSGIILTPNPSVCYVPLMSYGEETLTQYSMDTCAKLGLLKIDFLGIKYLTVIKKAKNSIKERYSSVYEKIPPQDDKVYEMLSKGYGFGLFQLESEGMKELLKRISPKNLKELCDVISLYRPGPKKYIESYIKGRKNPNQVVYEIEQIKPALEETYGCPIYQEQIMKICTDAAGFTLGHADTIRRAMAKKSISQMNEEKTSFIEGCLKKGILKEKATSLFEQISDFAKYAFNKSHGVAYALLSYETAYLKALFPKEYFSAKLNVESGYPKNMSEYFFEMSKMNVTLLPPCINRSAVEFIPEGDGIRYSLSAIKGVGKNTAKKITAERSRNGFFIDADDFISRLGGTIGTTAAIALARCGALDTFGETRHTLSNLCEETVSSGNFIQSNEEQISLSFDNVQNVKYLNKRVAEYTETELRFFEKEYTGVDFHFASETNDKRTKEKKFALYIKLTPNNKKALIDAFNIFSRNSKDSIVRIYNSQSGKTSELKDLFFSPTPAGIETLEKIFGKDNVKLKALERNT